MKQSALPEKKPSRKRGCLLSSVLTLALIAVIAVSAAEVILPNLTELISEGMDALGNRDGIPKALLELAERNPETVEFVRSYPQEHEAPHDPSLTEEELDGRVPLLLQWDKRWGYLPYGGEVAGLTACGPMCLSMTGIALTGNTEVFRPDKVLAFAADGGYFVDGAGSSWTLISEGGPALGLTVRELPLDYGTMKQELEQGRLIICAMGPGVFTTTGHFIVLSGVEDGKFQVCDPNSRQNSGKLWSYDAFSDQIRNLWALSA